jgi:hypothetical protein
LNGIRTVKENHEVESSIPVGSFVKFMVDRLGWTAVRGTLLWHYGEWGMLRRNKG